MKAIQRLFQYFDYKNIKPTRLERDLGLGNGYFGLQLKREADIGSSILEKIFNYCRDLDSEWLITGSGSMIRTTEREISTENIDPILLTKEADNTNCKRCEIKDELILSLQQQIELQNKLIHKLEGGNKL